jgi:hypothetical protein
MDALAVELQQWGATVKPDTEQQPNPVSVRIQTYLILCTRTLVHS